MKPVASILLCLTLALLPACDAGFDPFVPSALDYAFYGFLDAREDVQTVRVEQIADAIDPAPSDLRVTSMELVTGATRVWQDSTVVRGDGTEGTIHMARFRPQPGGVYRFEVARDGGPPVDVGLIAIPAEPPTTVLPPGMVGAVRTQRILIGSATRPERARVTYVVQRSEAAGPVTFVFDYDAQALSRGGYDVIVRLTNNAVGIRDALDVGSDDPDRVELLGIRLDYDLVQTRDLAMEGGGRIGRVGSAASFTVRWVLPTETVEAIGFEDAQDGG